MSVVRVGFDIDGCLADFNTPYIALIRKYTGIALPPVSDTYPNTWNYERAAGVEKSRENDMWKEIKESEDFWRDLPIIPGVVDQINIYLDRCKEHDIEDYFITNRAGTRVKEQTEDWLVNQLNLFCPTVLIARDKGLACKVLDLTHYIDDKVENVESVLAQSPTTKVRLLDAPWNRHATHLDRVYVLRAFIDLVIEDAEKGEHTHMETA